MIIDFQVPTELETEVILLDSTLALQRSLALGRHKDCLRKIKMKIPELCDLLRSFYFTGSYGKDILNIVGNASVEARTRDKEKST